MFNFSEKKYSSKGIYAIVNRINGKFYIGSTVNKKGFKNRFNQHLRQLRKKKHHSIALQRAWDKYGETNFSFFILREISDREITTSKFVTNIEQQYLDTFKPAYNIAKFAQAPKPKKRIYTEETKKKIAKQHRDNYKKHSKYKFIIKSPNGSVEEVFSLREYAEKHKLCQSNLTKVANGIRQSHKGYTVVKIAI